MNILYVNTNFHEGGAAKVARQLYYGMKKRGHNVYFLAGYPSKNDEECIIMNPSAFWKLYNIGTGVLQNNQVITRYRARKQILDIIRKNKIDIVHFHNVFENYIGIKDIAYIGRHCKVVWTLHDMWAVTGHCAHSYWCEGWKSGCTNCKEKRFYPAFYYNDVKYKYRLKKKSFAGQGITYVSPSHWLEQICRESYLQDEMIHVIENGIDPEVYKPIRKGGLRKKYGISEDKIVLFFTAAVVNNWGKGIQYLLDALEMLEDKEKYALCIAGNGNLEEQLQEFEVHCLGYISDEVQMNELYNLADMYVTPSMADTFPFVGIEAAAAGLPVIAFATGGLKEIVAEETGWLVEAGNAEELSSTISQAASDMQVLREKGINARQRAESLYVEQRMIDRYEKLYQQLSE